MNWKNLLTASRVGKTKEPSGLLRSAFEQDYDRIVFSHPFRRLQDKTQVHPLPEHDFVHTRLTHSLEVSSVGRSLGKKVGETILQRHQELAQSLSLFDVGAIVAAASLAHDLGNPPFGHAGEASISDFFSHHPIGQSFKEKVTGPEWHDLVSFEGNAQGFRILNKNQYGLSLTYATLGAFTKYPCPSFFPLRDKSHRSQKKFGYFQSEQTIFEEVASNLEMLLVDKHVWKRHPLAFLVEAADDICYSIIDLEDGCSLGLVSFEETVALFAAIIQERFDREKLNRIPGKRQKIGALRALAINKLIDECTAVFLDHEEAIMSGRFDKALIDECPSRNTVEEIIKISREKIYRARHVVEIEAAGHEVLPGLLNEFVQAGACLLERKPSVKYRNLGLLMPEEIRDAIVAPASETYTMLREIIDFISGMTDKYAISLYQKIKGFKI